MNSPNAFVTIKYINNTNNGKITPKVLIPMFFNSDFISCLDFIFMTGYNIVATATIIPILCFVHIANPARIPCINSCVFVIDCFFRSRYRIINVNNNVA